MEKRLLLRTQRNRIIENIVKLKLTPLDFIFLEIESGILPNCKVSKLVHKPTRYYFKFDFTHTVDQNWIEYYPTSEGKKKIQSTRSISIVMGEVYEWLLVIKRETAAPDLWATILDEKNIFEVASTPDLGEDLFSQAEQKYISEQLRLIEQRIIGTQELTQDKIDFLAGKIDYLDENIKRLGRFTWIHTAIGVFVTIMFGIPLPQDISKEIFSHLGRVISQVLQGEPHYLP